MYYTNFIMDYKIRITHVRKMAYVKNTFLHKNTVLQLLNFCIGQVRIRLVVCQNADPWQTYNCFTMISSMSLKLA